MRIIGKIMAGAGVVGGSLPAAYGQVPPAAPAAVVAVAVAQPDTVKALRRLFRARRTGGGVLLMITGATAATFTALIGSEESFGAGTDVVLSTAIAGLYTAPFWSVGAGKRIRFSRKKEQQTIDHFLTTRTLPPTIARRLKPRYFR